MRTDPFIYQFDALNRLTNVLANGSVAAGYAFDAVGNLQTISYGNGVTSQNQHDALNRLTNLVWKLNAGTLASFYYQVGIAGNQTNLSETVNGASRNYAWQYDTLYRLTNENISPIGNVGYALDQVGNRTNRQSSISQLPTASYGYNTNDWLAGDSYDSNGNTTVSSANSYQYDPLNHVTNVNNGAVLITYDGDGNRVKKTVGGVTTYYLLDDRNPSGYVQVMEEWTASGGVTNLSKVYNYGPSLISQKTLNPLSTNYFIYDGHGSTRALYDAGGSFVNAFAYDAYGALIASNGVPQTAYLYCAQQFDSDLGFYLNRARYLNPNTGRFLTADKIAGDQEDPRSLHRYIFAADNPVNNIDPLGQSFFAFDGTGNYPTERDKGSILPTPTNPEKMYEASLDPHRHYEIGVGTGIPGISLPGQAFGAGMGSRIRQAMSELEDDRKHSDYQVDIVGFSRGGIEAIEFANRIADKYPGETIRFVGLYDPVGSVGHPGGFAGYRFTLPGNVVNSVEAMAQDENRRMFPGTYANAKTTQWFRGVHSDIGGGFKDHDIADGVLQWMTDQAHGVSMDLNRIKKYGWNPDLNGKINLNHGFTSWFTRSGGRYVISDVGSYTFDGLN
jgi:RHS repeat-associated protein